jgi:sugar phosphate isomerase/epimerase
MAFPFPPAITVSLVPESRGGPFVFTQGLAESCALAASMGFPAVEIFPPSAESLDARELRHLLEHHGLKLAAMGTGAGWVVQKLRLTDPDPIVRGRARHFISEVVDFAGKLGAPAIIGSMQGRLEAGTSRAVALGWMAEALEQLAPRAHQYGVPLLLEPLNRYETNLFTTVGETLEFTRSLRTRNVKLLCDCFHMNIEEVSIEGALRLAGNDVGHMHLADSNRRAAGLGHTDFRPVIAALRDIGYTGYLSAEVLPLPDAGSAARKTIETVRSLAGLA